MRPFPIRPTICLLLLSDLLALLISGVIAYKSRELFLGPMDAAAYIRLIPAYLMFIPLYAALSLYPDFTMPRPIFFKRLSTGTSTGFLFFMTILLFGKSGAEYSRFTLLMAWFLSLFSVPLFRYLSGLLFCSKAWWGCPIIIFGPPDLCKGYHDHLQRYKQRGLIPLAYFGAETSAEAETMNYTPLGNTSREVKKQIQPYRKTHPDLLAVILLNESAPKEQHRVLRLIQPLFARLMLIPDNSFNMRLSVQVADFCGQLSLSLRQNLLDPYRLQLKNFMDFLLALVIFIPLLPLIFIIYIIIRLDSPGPGFYRHRRLGYAGKEIKVWKFRTMHINAERMLCDILEADPALRQEWELDQKLRKDPRITRVGGFLRKYSLDELPQILNVFTGDMSLVGPRPIVPMEITKYGTSYSVYTRVKPGVTGLWQVSGRNDLSYEVRVALDEYYIANWSIWMDIYILLRTPAAALGRHGAY
ncbi:MAG: undecaprenyl-phosphate galactose phosphotransferase WbaP [Deltaproteobacteria bacterium]|jgi:Undecaprenyl-phosphate galactose phosphotransferase WbaP|nr:undecaprenyl-phosphate galactose phosphotransferase WbaP [Deltaproteobacteria bacterium]